MITIGTTDSANDGWIASQGWQFQGWVWRRGEGEFVPVESHLTWGEAVYVPCQARTWRERLEDSIREEMMQRSLESSAHIWREMGRR